MGCNNIQFISNNVQGIKNWDKRIKIFENLKSKVDSNEVLFLQETHSCEKDEKKGNDDFKGTLFFSHGTTNSCRVAIGYSGRRSFILEERKTDKNGCLLLLDVAVDEQNFVRVNLYNANTVKDQLNTINELSGILKGVNNINAKQIILGGDFNLYFDSLLESQGGNPISKKIYCQNEWA